MCSSGSSRRQYESWWKTRNNRVGVIRILGGSAGAFCFHSWYEQLTQVNALNAKKLRVSGCYQYTELIDSVIHIVIKENHLNF